ncbi:cellulose synthase operon protein YhjQ/BcsQ [Actinomyces dentalis]|uniref:nucleotide-binding protein n=2 Tax=Actinomyces dentalis TaxID=272548 RepID=UPI0004065461|nr:cellulose synthase operon protein YhjQ/BcsQ [Actinomyces dentalis]
MPAATAPRVIIEPGQGEDPRLDGLVELVRDTTGRGPLLAASAAESAALARQILVVSRQDPADGGAGEGAGAPAAPAVLVLRRGAAGAETPAGSAGSGPGPVVVADLEDCLGPGGAGRLLGLLLSAQHPPLGRIVAVTGARGGIGATTVLLLLARALAAQGRRVAVVDADPAGGLGLHLGHGLEPGLCWDDLYAAETVFRPERLTDALPTWLGVPVLSGQGRGGPDAAARLEPVLRALACGHDLVLLDLPRPWPAPAGARVLLVTGLDLRSALAAQILAPRLAAQSGRPVELVVRRVGEDLDDAELAALTDCEILGRVPTDRSVRQRDARGDDITRGRGSARRAVRLLAERVLAGLDDEEPDAAGSPAPPAARTPAPTGAPAARAAEPPAAGGAGSAPAVRTARPRVATGVPA